MPQTYYLGARSLFVTVTAWLAIVLAALACTLGLAEQVTLISAGTPSTLDSAALAPLSAWLLAWLPWVHRAGLLLAVAVLAAGVGLLLRHEWARRTFIGLLLLAIVANLAGLWLQHEFVQSVVSATLHRNPLPGPAAEVFGGLATATRLMGGLLTLGLCLLCAWVIRRLMSPPVLQEFCA